MIGFDFYHPNFQCKELGTFRPWNFLSYAVFTEYSTEISRKINPDLDDNLLLYGILRYIPLQIMEEVSSRFLPDLTANRALGFSRL